MPIGGKIIKLKVNSALVLRLLILLGLIGLLAAHIIRQPQDYAFLASLKLSYLLPIVLLSLGRLLLDAVRFSATAAATWRELPVLRAFTYLIMSRLLNKLVPQSGLLYKARMLQRSGNAGIGDIASVFGTLAWMQLFFSLLVSIVVLVLLKPTLVVAGIPALTTLIALCLLLLLGTVAVVILARFMQGVSTPNKSRLQDLIYRAAGTVQRLSVLWRQPRLVVINAITISSAVWMAMLRLVLAYAMLGECLSVSFSAVFIAVNRLATLITITPGNLGITEAIYAALSNEIGLGVAKGVAAALLVRLVVFLTLLVCGALIALLNPRLATGDA